MAYDIIIRSGLVLDGTGKPAIAQDIAIENGKIAAMGTLDRAKAKTEINAAGKYVAPGFIDITNHSDTHPTMFRDPAMESMIMQGVTTVIGGNCGASLAPLVSADAIRSVSKWADFSQIGINWTGVDEFLTTIDKIRLGANFGTLVGYGTLRRGIVGDAARPLSLEEKEKIILLLGRALDQGAFGFSLGLSYGHERVSTTDELIELASPLAGKRGILKVHLRSEGAEIMGAMNEAIRIGREAGVSIIISHFKVIGRQSWSYAQKALDLIAYAQSTGVNIWFDVSPYRTTGSPLYLLIPPWARRGGFADLFGRIDSQVERKRIVEALERGTLHYDRIRVIAAKHASIVGKTLAKVAEQMDMPPAEALLEIVRGNEGRVEIIGRTISSKNTLAAMKDANSLIASDGFALSQDAVKSGDMAHPRSFGAFPHFWHRMVNDLKILKPEEAIVKITGAPATILGIQGRGIITAGNFADIVIFDPLLIRDRATYTNPYRYPAGIEWVLVNGKIVVEQGKHTGVRAGAVIRK
ncbi:MAG: D-aminoacylase [Candidatus Sungiibacteriota bacterium]